MIAEAIVCFGPPLYYLPWGLVALVLNLPMALAGERFAIFNALIPLSGLLGAFALFHVLRHFVTGKSERFARSWIAIVLVAGLWLQPWALVTNLFREFQLDIEAVLLVILPMLASVHFLCLVRHRLQAGAA